MLLGSKWLRFSSPVSTGCYLVLVVVSTNDLASATTSRPLFIALSSLQHPSSSHLINLSLVTVAFDHNNSSRAIVISFAASVFITKGQKVGLPRPAQAMRTLRLCVAQPRLPNECKHGGAELCRPSQQSNSIALEIFADHQSHIDTP